MGGANTDADANSDANERDPSHFTAGNLTEKTGFETAPSSRDLHPSLDLILSDGAAASVGAEPTRLTSQRGQCKLLRVREFK